MPASAKKATFSANGPSPLQAQLVVHLRRVIDACLFATMIFAPLFMGGRGPVGKLVLVSLVSVAAISWFAVQWLSNDARWRWSGVEWLILAGAILILVQLAPLPQNTLGVLSPSLSKLLPMWTGDAQNVGGFGTWSTISLTPEDTRGGLAVYLAYAILFLILVQRIENLDDLELILKWLAIAAVVMASLGMLQLMFGNGKFLWVYELPNRDTFVKVNGSFQNQNHFAHFLALGVGPLIWWLQRLWSAPRAAGSFSSRSTRKSRQDFPWVRHALAVGLGIVLVASLLTYSRGGVITMGLVAILTVAIYFWKGLLGKKSLVGVALFGVVVCGSLFIYGREILTKKMGSLASGSIEEMSKTRADLWRAIGKSIAEFPLFGTGIGSHREVYRIFMEEYYDVEFSHAESGYMQVAEESGLIGLALLLVGFAIVLRWCLVVLWQDPEDLRLTGMIGAVLPGVAASLIHSFGDFVWYIPACVTLTLSLVAVACRAKQFVQQGSAKQSSARSAPTFEVALPRVAVIGVTIMALVCSGMLIRNRLPAALAAPHWDAYLKLALIKSGTNTKTDAEDREKLAAMAQHLERVLAYDPADSRALLRMAAISLQRFELEQRFSINPLPLSQIRDAALASAFPTKEAQDAWLNVAVGENRRMLDTALNSCRRALKLCPLEGAGYVYMVDLCFLEGPDESAKIAYIKQASLVRPYDGLVLYVMGREALLSQDWEKALPRLREAFRRDQEAQTRIIESYGGQMPAQYFVETFQPDSKALDRLFWHYKTLELEGEAQYVGERLAIALVKDLPPSPRQAAEQLHHAASIHATLGQYEQAYAAQSRALELDPNDFFFHRTAASYLGQLNRVDEAMKHLEWCLRRRPDDSSLREDMSAMKLRLTQVQANLR